MPKTYSLNKPRPQPKARPQFMEPPLPNRTILSPLKAEQGYIFESGKVYTHSVGLSCAFRQWRATDSHCHFLHGYSLQVTLTFSALELDERNWVVDFGGLKNLKGWLESTFDHTTLVAEDDPKITLFKELQIADLIQLRIFPHVGMEAMAYYIFQYAEQWLKDAGFNHTTLQEVEVREHESNFARYKRA